MSKQMEALCVRQPGFLRMVHATTDEGYSVTTCYWRDLQAIADWKANTEHQSAQLQGKNLWYDHYQVEVARVERAYSWHRENA